MDTMMEHGSAIITLMLSLPISLHLSSADAHSLQYLYTAVRGLHLPEFTAVGLVDGEQFVYYDSNIRKVILKTEWTKKIDAEIRDYWNGVTQYFLAHQERFKDNVAAAMQSFNHTKGVHTLQKMFGCNLHDDDVYSQYGYDGEDFVRLDLKSVSWTPVKPEAIVHADKWKSTGHDAQFCKDFLKHECIEWLKNFVSYGNETMERKVRPEVSVFQKNSSSPEVVCHATGFFPGALNITWQKDGEDVHEEDVELRETLPNQDGNFQKRSVLKVPAEELQKHTYTCVIQHSSLEKELVLSVSEPRILRGGVLIAIIVGVVATLAVVAGIVVWKKKYLGETWKKTGFRPVSQNPMVASTGDSSSNSS